jgi:hypothetical protein
VEAPGELWLYDIGNDSLQQIAQHDPALFTSGAPGFLTTDEESSGVIDVSKILGRGWFLLDVQAHKASADPELVEGGQLVVMHVDTEDDGPDDEGKDDGDGSGR